MKLSKAHLDFYMMKKYPAPKFGAPWAAKSLPNVNSLINKAAGIKEDYDKHNTNNLIRRMHGQALRNYLYHLYEHPGTIINPKKRSAYAFRLLGRLCRQ